MSLQTSVPENLEERFHPPPGWRWHVFKNAKGRSLRFGSVFPESRVPDAVVIGLPGLGDFIEKYFELARDLLDMKLAFWMMDWQGQGHSERYLVKHSSVHPDVGRIPLVMLGQGMGANIGLRYLHRHPDMFACAAFTSPLLGIKSLRWMPSWVRLGFTAALQEALDQSYLEFGGKDWTPYMRSKFGKDVYSSDPVRDAVHKTWCEHDKQLQVGNVTYGYLHEANLSCAKLQKLSILTDIKTPCLFALGKNDKLSDTKTAKKVIKQLPNARLLEIQGAKNEIIMERDDIRSQFFNSFSELLKVNKISEQLKPF
jgi:lysophospholipase